jgi:hypothetical protein
MRAAISCVVLFLTSGFGIVSARAETLRWVCEYKTVVSPKGLSSELFQLEFALDTISKKSVLIGNAGVSDVTAYNGDQGITFQERLASGAIQTTTITHSDGKSVHSRHSMLRGALVPTQYYGECR